MFFTPPPLEYVEGGGARSETGGGGALLIKKHNTILVTGGHDKVVELSCMSCINMTSHIKVRLWLHLFITSYTAL